MVYDGIIAAVMKSNLMVGGVVAHKQRKRTLCNFWV